MRGFWNPPQQQRFLAITDRHIRMPDSRPTLLYDGDCGICRTWVAYWRALTDERVIYRPYQEASGDFPAIPREKLARAIFFIEPDGATFSGAAATFRVLRAGGQGTLDALYRYCPGFAPVSEGIYDFFAQRRGVLTFFTHLLWGRKLEPARYALTSFLFLRLFGAIYIAAFLSLAVQIRALVGHDGLLPVAPYLAAAHQGWGASAYWRLPTLFWLNASDAALLSATLLGALCGLLILVNVFVRPALVAALVLYLSLIYAGQTFLNYQWDQLLVETGFLAIFLSSGMPLVVFLFRWLAFRFLFLAGVTKLLSGDPSWQHLTALETHFFTQPLPAPLAWPAERLPHLALQFGTAAALFVELVLAFLIFLPRRPRMLAAFGVLIFQLMIIATGNYNFFNLLTLLLCLFLFDDQALAKISPKRFVAFIQSRVHAPSRAMKWTAVLLACIVVPAGFDRLYEPFAHKHLPVIGALTNTINPLLIVNPYGLFITTTTTRPELVIQGSNDNVHWRDYTLPYYPGPVTRAPRWNIPHQPRLDWQMWFAAYGNAADNPWLIALLQALLEARPQVLSLIAVNPFSAHPPHAVRIALYDYRFADPATQAATGQWWVRRETGLYVPPVSLGDLQRMHGLIGAH
jgi:predicted DCC family thiol-disulfide oxidoreductase YuxK